MDDRKIFISYSRKDQEMVFDIVKRIEHQVGVKCWIDINGIESGQQFVDVMMAAIENCEVVVFMMSESSLHSEYVRKEVNYAHMMKKRIIPVILDGDTLRGWFAFDFGLSDFIVSSNPIHMTKLMIDLNSWFAPDELHKVAKDIVPYFSCGKAGFADMTTGEQCIPCKYEMTQKFSDGIAKVRDNRDKREGRSHRQDRQNGHPVQV